MTAGWRIVYNPKGDVADLLAMPAAVAEGRLAGRYIMAARATPDTVIFQGVRTKGVLAGAEVNIDRAKAGEHGIDVAVQPRGGRGSLRPAGTISLQEMMLKGGDEFQAVGREDDDLAALIYTSGTTGNPKGVMLSHGNFAAECAVTDESIKTDPEKDRFASLVPFFHVFGLANVCVLALHRGCASILVPQYSPRKFVKTIVRSKATVVLGIPTQYRHLAIAARRSLGSEKPALKYCVSGAAPLDPEMIDTFQEAFGAVIVEGYGMTESTSAVAVNPPDHIKPGSIGKPCPGVEMKVADDDGNDLPMGEPGEIMVRGSVVCKGYYNLPQETEQAIVDGWLRSGDIGHMDADGYYYVTGRKKDIIIKGGFNISPKEIEDTICRRPEVLESAVVGVREDTGRELIRAFCVLVQGEAVTPEEIMDFCRKELAAYKTPDEVRFLTALPRNATGKILRRELKGDYTDMRLIERDGE